MGGQAEDPTTAERVWTPPLTPLLCPRLALRQRDDLTRDSYPERGTLRPTTTGADVSRTAALTAPGAPAAQSPLVSAHFLPQVFQPSCGGSDLLRAFFCQGRGELYWPSAWGCFKQGQGQWKPGPARTGVLLALNSDPPCRCPWGLSSSRAKCGSEQPWRCPWRPLCCLLLLPVGFERFVHCCFP